MPSKHEPLKEQTVQPAVVRKPTVIRISAKPAKGKDPGTEYISAVFSNIIHRRIHLLFTNCF